MSDSAANAGVEDVVTSIKRLVSDRSEADDASEGQAVPAEKLVLTPALRVAEQTAPQAQHRLADPDDQAEMDAPANAGLERTEGTDPPPMQPAFLRRDQLAAVDLEATIAELEAAVAAHEQEWEPDGSEETADFASTPHILKPASDGDRSEAGPMRLETPTGPSAADTVSVASDPWVSGVSNPSQTDDSGDASVPHVDPEKRQDAEDDQDDLVLDEMALRELVAQIVREELKGPLGERITRNVRKLVRREIFRIVEGQSRD
ncbi:MAG: hypothetical protein AAF667_00465 [Pseudomonadota bacterium]